MNDCKKVFIAVVGIRSLFGDIVSACVSLRKGQIHKVRRACGKIDAFTIISKCCYVGVGSVNVFEINRRGEEEAVELAIRRSLYEFGLSYERVLIDESLQVKGLGLNKDKVGRSKNNRLGICCAKVIAEGYRLELAREYAERYPGYGIEVHCGDGTAMHITSIKKLGITPLHRETCLELVQ